MDGLNKLKKKLKCETTQSSCRAVWATGWEQEDLGVVIRVHACLTNGNG